MPLPPASSGHSLVLNIDQEPALCSVHPGNTSSWPLVLEMGECGDLLLGCYSLSEEMLCYSTLSIWNQQFMAVFKCPFCQHHIPDLQCSFNLVFIVTSKSVWFYRNGGSIWVDRIRTKINLASSIVRLSPSHKDACWTVDTFPRGPGEF